MAPKRKSGNPKTRAAKRGRQGATATRSQPEAAASRKVPHPVEEAAAASTEVPGVSDDLLSAIVKKVTEAVSKNLAPQNTQPAQAEAIPHVAEPESGLSTADEVATKVVDLTVAEAQQAITGIETLIQPQQAQPTQLFCSSALAVDARVSDKVRAKIWANEYVNFDQLLPSPVVDQGYRLAVSNNQGDTPAISLEPISQVKKITQIDTWVKCFHIFVAVYTTKFPVEAPVLMKYGEIIQDLAARGFNWKYYDENFRFLRQSQHMSLPWSSIHSELWLRSQSHGNLGRRQPPSEASRPNPSFTRVPNGYCFRFQRGQPCQNAKCSFKHTCYKCEGEHRASNCNFRGSQKQFARQASASQQKTSNTSQK